MKIIVVLAIVNETQTMQATNTSKKFHLGIDKYFTIDKIYDEASYITVHEAGTIKSRKIRTTTLTKMIRNIR